MSRTHIPNPNPLMVTVHREYLIRQLWNSITSEKEWRYQSIIGDTWDALGYHGFVDQNHIHRSESVKQDNESYALACGTVTLLILAAEGELT